MHKRKFNDGWHFYEGTNSSIFSGSKAQKQDEEIILPHDASILKKRSPKVAGGTGNGFFPEVSGQYIKHFIWPASEKGKEVWLEFEGVYHDTFIYVNNAYAGRCPFGYGNFFVCLTPYIRYDEENTIRVVVKNRGPSSRWYSGSGIYRSVNLLTGGAVHFTHSGVHLTTVDADTDEAVIRIQTRIQYGGRAPLPVNIGIQLFDEDGQLTAECKMPVTLLDPGTHHYQQLMTVVSPKLWDTENPAMYQYKAYIEENGSRLDDAEGSFGIRTLSLSPRRGLCINGRSIKLRGGCIHHDNGIIGAMEFPSAARERIRKLKAAGYNAVRSAHNPMSEELLDACDHYGMLVMDEFTDVWMTTKADFDYGEYITEWWDHDLTNMVDKDYNHPCVIMYSIGNEIPETGNPQDVQFGKQLADRIRMLDGSRYVVNCLNLMLSVKSHMPEIMDELNSKVQAADQMGKIDGDQEINTMMNNFGELLNYVIATQIAGELTEEAFSQTDIAGYNYGTCRYEKDIYQYPDRIIVGSETYPPQLDENWQLVNSYPNLIGDFSWAAWDYLGEVGIGRVIYGRSLGMSIYADYPYKAAYCGDFNLIGDRRPVSYWRQSIWGLLPGAYVAVQPPEYYGVEKGKTNWVMSDAVRCWTWNGYEGRRIVVEAYSHAEEIALYVNGRLVEKKAVGEHKKNVATFDTVYIPGKLEVVALINGIEIGRDEILTAGRVEKIIAFADRTEIPMDGSDIVYIDIHLCDGEGIRNPREAVAVTVSVEGPARLIGYGSADPESEEDYFTNTAIAYEGRLRAAIRGNKAKGKVGVTFSALQCEAVTVELETV